MKRREALKRSATMIVGLGAIPSMSLFLQSCGIQETANYQPKYLTQDQYSTINVMVEMILPKTETPGANEAGVGPFIDLLFGEYFEVEGKSKMESGLQDFMSNCTSRFSKKFHELEEKLRVEFLTELDSSEDPESFFKSIKGLTLWGYFTSELGMKSMDYRPVPGQYRATKADSNTKNLVGNR